MNRHERRAAGRNSPKIPHHSGAATPDALLGNALLRQGRLEEALNAFNKAAEVNPGDAGLWISLGKILVQLGRPADALSNFQQALKLDPRQWDAACQSGVLLYQSGRLEEAVAQFDVCDNVQPNHAPTLYMRAVFLRGLGRFEQALAGGKRAFALDPDNADNCNNIGNDLRSLDRHEEALQWFDRALALRPDFAEALYNKATSLGKLDRTDAAFAIYQTLKTLDLNHAVTDWHLADLLQTLGRSEQALVHIDRCDRQQPNNAATLRLRALVLCSLKRFEEALADDRRAHALDPDDADTCNNIGTHLQALGRHEEALQWFDQALALRPDFVEAFCNKATSFYNLRRFEECLAANQRAQALDSDSALPDWNRSHLHLLTGNFEAGWALREAKWRMPHLSKQYPKFPQPRWRGEAIEGKTILVHFDEGLGDTIQFARYIPMLAARGARVILVVEPPLLSLLSKLPGVPACFSTADSLPPFDMHCPIMELPPAFGTRLDTIPGPIAYLPSPSAEAIQVWQDRLGAHDRLRVGLVWSGNPKHINDHNRSISLRWLSGMLDVDARFISLQKAPRPEDQAILRERTDILDLTAGLTDFTETAALISCLDLVIAVDTSVAHLAAAMGRPTWILLPYIPDWRWLLDREDSPWYPTVRLFRQAETRDYGEVIDRMRTELAALIAAREASRRASSSTAAPPASWRR